MLFRELVAGKKYYYAVYLSQDNELFLPIILDDLHAIVFKEMVAGKDYKSLDFIIPTYLFILDLLRGLDCSLDGIFLKETEQPGGQPPTLDAMVRVSQSNEIGRCVASVDMVLYDAATIAILTKQPMLLPSELSDKVAIRIPMGYDDVSTVMSFVRDQIAKFDSGT